MSFGVAASIARPVIPRQRSEANPEFNAVAALLTAMVLAGSRLS